MRSQNRLLLALAVFTVLVLAAPFVSRLLPLDGAPKTAPGAAAGTLSEPVIGATSAGLSGNLGTSPDLESSSVDDLIAATRDGDWKERWYAVNTLGKRKDPRAIPALVDRALYDVNHHPRWRRLTLGGLPVRERGGQEASGGVRLRRVVAGPRRAAAHCPGLRL